MDFEQLIKHLNPQSKLLLEKSISLAANQSHHNLEIVHCLIVLFTDMDDTSLDRYFQALSLNKMDVLKELDLAKQYLNHDNSGFPKISKNIVRVLFESWMLASNQFNAIAVEPIHIIGSMLTNTALRSCIATVSTSLVNIDREFAEDILSSVLTKNEDSDVQVSQNNATAINRFTINLTEQARAGKFANIVGRDDEIRQMVDVLLRKKQNNPILTGEAGVGKTAVVEGLACRVIEGDVPQALKNIDILSLDTGLLTAGAGVKGELENRLQSLIKEINNSSQAIILFVDEAHVLLGNKQQGGSSEAANILKPALARGELRTIAATTWAEYKRYFESDAALTRRFQAIKVDEPDENTAIEMLRSIVDGFERHHDVVILDNAIQAAVKLSHRYIADRCLPDKAVSLLDTACARVNLSQQTAPMQIEKLTNQLSQLELRIDRLQSEQNAGFEQQQELIDLEIDKQSLYSRLDYLNDNYKKQTEIIQNILALRLKNQESPNDEQVLQLKTMRQSLSECQNRAAYVYECVDEQIIASVVSDWTGIPVGKMTSSASERALQLESQLSKRVVGQRAAIAKLSETMKRSTAKLNDETKPLGVFLLLGPSGVGKTETALALADEVYGSSKNMTVINMSEFKEEHKVSLLMGSPPGYVGYGEGGLLTEAIRRNPYSVVLLDEMEKAHPSIQDVFYQVFDKGVMRDSEGREVDFKNALIIMTSNACSDLISQLCEDEDLMPDLEGIVDSIAEPLREVFKPAFLGRVQQLPYLPLKAEALNNIIDIQLRKVNKRFIDNYGFSLNFDKTVSQHILENISCSDLGARKITAMINDVLLTNLADFMLTEYFEEEFFDSLNIYYENDFLFTKEERSLKKIEII